MVGVTKINISSREFKDYKEWVENTQEKSMQEYLAEQMKIKLQTLRKQEGKCNQRSIFLKKGEYKGSCVWRSWKNRYEIWVRSPERHITYGFFSNLYSAERELKRLFENDVENIETIAKKQQKHYRLQHRLKTRPRPTDNTLNISKMTNERGAVVFYFHEPFINPLTKKEQKLISWGKQWFKHYPKKLLINECIRIDDPVQMIHYRKDLKERLKTAKKKQGENDEE